MFFMYPSLTALSHRTTRILYCFYNVHTNHVVIIHLPLYFTPFSLSLPFKGISLSLDGGHTFGIAVDVIGVADVAADSDALAHVVVPNISNTLFITTLSPSFPPDSLVSLSPSLLILPSLPLRLSLALNNQHILNWNAKLQF